MEQKPIAVGSLITADMTRKDARTVLYDAGWDFVGGGSFSSVWRSPDQTRVVKVTKPDPGGEATLRVALKHPDNPHLPTIFGWLALANGGTAVETEALLPDDGGAYEEFEGSDEWYDYGEGWDSPLAEALRALNAERKAAHVSWDEHEENIMLRPDGTIVLTDLLYSMAALRHAAGYGGAATNDYRRGSAHSLHAAQCCSKAKQKARKGA